jgi:hypothetical protein
MHKSRRVFIFGLLASSLVMLVMMPFLNNNGLLNTTMAQGYEDYYGDNSYYSEYPTDENNMSVEQVHLKDFL